MAAHYDVGGSVVEDGPWQSLPFEMTSDGMEEFKRLVATTPRAPMVYVHVECPGRRVLRIGGTNPGIHRRWGTAPDGHVSTFQWATTKTGPYGERHGKRREIPAVEFPHYVLFFKRLERMTTRVWFLEWAERPLKRKEDALIRKYHPVWEQFFDRCNEQEVRQGLSRGPAVSACDFSDPALPRIDNLLSNLLWPFPS